MTRAKVKKRSTFIDMTAMSDVTVLLLTFFMLTSTFIQKEPVIVKAPASVSEIKIPETDILQILVEESGRVYLSLDRQEDRMATLQKVGGIYNITFTPEEIANFRLVNSFGVPIQQMKGFLELNTQEQDKFMNSPGAGIPIDSLDNQFKTWISQAQSVANARLGGDGKLKIAIKADEATPYPAIKKVMSSLQDIHQNQYNLITTLKKVTR